MKRLVRVAGFGMNKLEVSDPLGHCIVENVGY